VIRNQASLLLTKDTDQAEKLLQKALKADPQSAMTYYDLETDRRAATLDEVELFQPQDIERAAAESGKVELFQPVE